MTKSHVVSRKAANRRRKGEPRRMAWDGGSDTTADLRFERTRQDEARVIQKNDGESQRKTSERGDY